MDQNTDLLYRSELWNLATVTFVIIELFSGIMIGSTACSQLGLHIVATFYSEIQADAMRVAATLFPEAVSLGDISFITAEVVDKIVNLHPNSVFLVMGGPPCQDVSLLNEERRRLGKQISLQRGVCESISTV